MGKIEFHHPTLNLCLVFHIPFMVFDNDCTFTVLIGVIVLLCLQYPNNSGYLFSLYLP